MNMFRPFQTSERGFTLIEILVAASVLSLLALAMYVGVSISLDASRLATAQNKVQNNIREVFPAISREIETAARLVTAAGIPGVEGPTVFADGVEQAAGATGDLVRFQVPSDNTGANWSTPIQFRFVNEDVNQNGYLDGGEDTVDNSDPAQDGNGDGKLTRWIVREQDTDGDGSFDSAGERRVLGAANEMQTVQFSINPAGDFLSITLISEDPMPNTGQLFVEEGEDTVRARTIQAQVTTRVYILN